ncbi:MAG: HEPN domain-containing protein [Thermodesulfobacteriota bacterium]|nr:HEPN domain-containing protein [Thermodesulfobacteriota bacterium]
MVTIEDAKEVSNVIIEAVRPVSVFVFGSVAKEGVGQDLDLLVIVDDKTGITSDINLTLHKCLKNYYRRFDIDPFIIPLSIFNKYHNRGSPFLRLILKEGRSLYMKEAIEEWLKQAHDELNMAEYLLGGRFFRGSCFHSQQSIEKSIKARLLKEGWELERIHSIERLVTIGEKYNIKIDLSDEEVVLIDNIYRGRYPAETGLLPLGEPSEAEAQKAFAIAKRIFKEVEAALKS